MGQILVVFLVVFLFYRAFSLVFLVFFPSDEVILVIFREKRTYFSVFSK